MAEEIELKQALSTSIGDDSFELEDRLESAEILLLSKASPQETNPSVILSSAVHSDETEDQRESISSPDVDSTQLRHPAKTSQYGQSGWQIPALVSANPEEARALIKLPEFNVLLIEKARVISGRFPFAEAEYKNLRGSPAASAEPEIPHFEKVFRIAADIASVRNVQQDPDYDTLLVLTAWYSVRPQQEGFLGS